ncbi:MAG: hypothetical protein Q7S53_00880 [bacterium]|nr:hypothetical protein [bacterium]
MITKKQFTISLVAALVLSSLFMVLTGFVLEGEVVRSTGCEPYPYPDCPSSATYGFGWPLDYREVVSLSGLSLHAETDYDYLNGALDFLFYFIPTLVILYLLFLLKDRREVNN